MKLKTEKFYWETKTKSYKNRYQWHKTVSSWAWKWFVESVMPSDKLSAKNNRRWLLHDCPMREYNWTIVLTLIIKQPTNHKSFIGLLSSFQHITNSFCRVRGADFGQLQVITDLSVFTHQWEKAVLRQIHHLHSRTGIKHAQWKTFTSVNTKKPGKHSVTVISSAFNSRLKGAVYWTVFLGVAWFGCWTCDQQVADLTPIHSTFM